jgi:hypothetical protein
MLSDSTIIVPLYPNILQALLQLYSIVAVSSVYPTIPLANYGAMISWYTIKHHKTIMFVRYITLYPQ